MTARRRTRTLLLLLAAVPAGCGTLTTTGGEVIDASTGVVTSDDGTATVSLPVGLEDPAAGITIESLDLAAVGGAPGADAGGLAVDVLEGLGHDADGATPEDLDAFDLDMWGGWRVAFSEPWFEEHEHFGIGSQPVFGLTTMFWGKEFTWPTRLLPFDPATDTEAEPPTPDDATGATPVPVPIVVRVDEEGSATLPDTVVTGHPAGITMSVPLEGAGTVTAFGGGVAVSVAPERLRALVDVPFVTNVTFHVAEDFGGLFGYGTQHAYALGSANVAGDEGQVHLVSRDGATAQMEFVCTAPGLGRFGVLIESIVASSADQLPEQRSHEVGSAMRLGVVECLDPDDQRLPESVLDDLPAVMVGLAQRGDTADAAAEPPSTGAQQLPGPPSEADRPPSLVGPCDGRAILDDGTVVDPSSSAGVYVVPRAGDAFYLGSVDASVTEPRGFAGSVVLHLPPPLAAVPVGSWSGTGEGTSATGVQSWDLTGPALPPGVRIPLEVVHRDDAAGHCSASLIVAFEGGYTDAPYGPAGAAATLIGLAGVGLAGLPKRT